MKTIRKLTAVVLCMAVAVPGRAGRFDPQKGVEEAKQVQRPRPGYITALKERANSVGDDGLTLAARLLEPAYNVLPTGQRNEVAARRLENIFMAPDLKEGSGIQDGKIVYQAYSEKMGKGVLFKTGRIDQFFNMNPSAPPPKVLSFQQESRRIVGFGMGAMIPLMPATMTTLAFAAVGTAEMAPAAFRALDRTGSFAVEAVRDTGSFIGHLAREVGSLCVDGAKVAGKVGFLVFAGTAAGVASLVIGTGFVLREAGRIVGSLAREVGKFFSGLLRGPATFMANVVKGAAGGLGRTVAALISYTPFGQKAAAVADNLTGRAARMDAVIALLGPGAAGVERIELTDRRDAFQAARESLATDAAAHKTFADGAGRVLAVPEGLALKVDDEATRITLSAPVELDKSMLPENLRDKTGTAALLKGTFKVVDGSLKLQEGVVAIDGKSFYVDARGRYASVAGMEARLNALDKTVDQKEAQVGQLKRDITQSATAVNRFFHDMSSETGEPMRAGFTGMTEELSSYEQRLGDLKSSVADLKSALTNEDYGRVQRSLGKLTKERTSLGSQETEITQTAAALKSFEKELGTLVHATGSLLPKIDVDEMRKQEPTPERIKANAVYYTEEKLAVKDAGDHALEGVVTLADKGLLDKGTARVWVEGLAGARDRLLASSTNNAWRKTVNEPLTVGHEVISQSMDQVLFDRLDRMTDKHASMMTAVGYTGEYTMKGLAIGSAVTVGAGALVTAVAAPVVSVVGVSFGKLVEYGAKKAGLHKQGAGVVGALSGAAAGLGWEKAGAKGASMAAEKMGLASAARKILGRKEVEFVAQSRVGQLIRNGADFGGRLQKACEGISKDVVSGVKNFGGNFEVLPSAAVVAPAPVGNMANLSDEALLVSRAQNVATVGSKGVERADLRQVSAYQKSVVETFHAAERVTKETAGDVLKDSDSMKRNQGLLTGTITSAAVPATSATRQASSWSRNFISLPFKPLEWAYGH